MKKILGRLIIVAPAVIIQILWMNFLYNKLNNSALVTLLLTILAFLFVIYIINKRDETSYKILWLITILTAYLVLTRETLDCATCCCCWTLGLRFPLKS